MATVEDSATAPSVERPARARRYVVIFLRAFGAALLVLVVAVVVLMINLTINRVDHVHGDLEDLADEVVNVQSQMELLLQIIETSHQEASGSPRYGTKSPGDIEIDLVMTPGVRNGKPTEAKSRFVIGEDPWAIAHFTFKNVSGKHLIVINWLTPDGDLMLRTTKFKSLWAGKTNWFWLSLKDSYPVGNWTVEAYMDGALFSKREFEVVR